MKIIVTGGAGFIGSHLVDKLIERNHEVIILDNLSTGKIENINKKAKFYEIDIRDEKIEKIIRDLNPEIIFHLAAQINVRKSVEDPLFDNEVNVIGSLNLIRSFLKVKDTEKKKFIFASTGGAIYGETDKIPTDEETIPFPLSPYGISKLTVEKYLHIFWRFNRLKYISLRLGNVYGPRQNPFAEAGVVAIFIGRVLRNQNVIIYGDGNQTRDFVYVDDVVKSFIKAMEYGGTGIFNVGTEKETSVNQIFEYIKKFLNIETEKLYSPPKKGDIERSCLKIEKIKNTLGWEPETPIDEGIKKTVNWFRGKI